MNTIEVSEHISIKNVPAKSFQQVLSLSPSKTETSKSPFISKAKLETKHGLNIYIYFAHEKRITQYSKQLTDIDDIITKYTSTKEGKEKWEKAEKELQEELLKKVLSGKMNKVKYYRIINKMDQKTLANLSGLKQPNISRIEKSGYIADTKTYEKIAKVFRINYKELLP